MERFSLVRYGRGMRSGDQLLRSGTKHCMFCNAETSHNTVRHFVEDRYGPSRKKPRTIEVCQKCRGYKIIPMSGEQSYPDAAEQ
jgi:hypothetical protein